MDGAVSGMAWPQVTHDARIVASGLPLGRAVLVADDLFGQSCG
jgi:hypothetical protein